MPRHDHYTKSIASAVGKVVKAADPAREEGRSAERVPPETTSHAFQHHYASVLIAAGASVIEVAERLGHKDGSLVLRTYGHLFEGQEDRTRRAIDAAWAAPAKGGSALHVPVDKAQGA